MNDDHWLTRPSTIKLLWIVFVFVLALTIIAGVWLTEEPHFEIERLFAFNAAYGFVVCAAMILVAKVLGVLLKRRDTYYEERASDD
jgi:apolipoprotein N-acyltransferase